ncbi:hypothetical protein [Maribacter arenosus]|uniref:Uncharacterized protein n=1 Tax=Maribacter arenosus TaxID=1854708 RepID=A0ABR7VKE4_9FLAO|nr:hypothetical protein [Maribacter arenosus]MBD0852647.1 hypothetical protein [Maribacter arenosus]
MKNNCIQKTNNKIIVFQENRSKLIILNKNQINTTKVTVDGCEITSGLRCDFMLLAQELEYFIELKGQDIEHSIKQLIATINKLSSNPKNMEKSSFIICTRSPLSSASIQNLQVKFKKNFNSKLIIKSSPFSQEI